jgi:23S rRNA pseudouridine1911/1915/1917 synthase
VNGHIITAIRYAVRGGEHIELTPTLSDEAMAFVPEPMALDVVYADPHIIVLNKPIGLVVHPAAGNWSGTLLNGLLYHYPELAKLPRAGIVHRLDKDTSGLLVIARSLEAQTDLVRQLQARTVKRHYLAIVFGETAEQGTIDAPIGRDPRSRLKMAVTQSGKLARTHFYRLATTSFAQLKVSLLRCELETGRTHQIRVHLASLKHPLLGDMLYGRKLPLPIPFARQALHAYGLGLQHPIERVEMRWQIEVAADMVCLAEQLGLPMTLPSI